MKNQSQPGLCEIVNNRDETGDLPRRRMSRDIQRSEMAGNFRKNNTTIKLMWNQL